MKHLLALLILLLLLAARAADYPARVVGISDGDTITVLTAEKKQVKVRLWGIDAPETGQDFGTQAKKAASEMAFGKDVTIREHDKDHYGRTVAEVILPDGRNLSRETVIRGATLTPTWAESWWRSRARRIDAAARPACQDRFVQVAEGTVGRLLDVDGAAPENQSDDGAPLHGRRSRANRSQSPAT